jgi:hypothetical protein
MQQEAFTWFAAVDCGSEKHQGCVLDARGGIAGEREFSHSGAGLTELCDWNLSIAGDANVVGVAVEVPHEPVVDVLLAATAGCFSRRSDLSLRARNSVACRARAGPPC